MTDFADRVQKAVGETYRIERELGGGGMSRVFLADEVRLDRKVVIKVLPPEMAAGVNVERFEREIQLAAKLQHPHIVPLLTAGAEGDLLYYVMPFIEGESLRAKLSRQGELPIGEAVRILEEVLDALSYAHQHGIVHRDIKPDNVMLAGRHAVVTDFGVAKAVASSTGASSLTSLGVALGTPAYMSPEQAAADPHVDHRADIYALGAMAYEMLTGRPPFTGPTPQSVLSAHVTQPPEPVSQHRDTVPPALAELVMRCLAKKPADRPQHAEDLIPQLAALLTPSGGMTPTATEPVAAVDYREKAARAHPLRVGLLFSVIAVVVLVAVYGLMIGLGLPSWVFLAAAGLMVAGLPIMLLTGQNERKRALAQAMGEQTLTPVGMKKLFTWKRALVGGGVAFAGLAVLAGGAMAMRAMGVGPFATLVSSGALKDRQTIILADFVNHAPDSTLGPSLTEAFRVDLSQSRTVQLMDPQQVAGTLQRMQRPENTPLTPGVAREVAERASVTAMVTGQIDPVGTGYVLSASVVDVGDSRVLTAVRATADDDAHLIPALDNLSRDLRARIGESLVTIRRTPPLDQVTTPSLDALRKYTEADRRFDAGDYGGAIGLLHQAIARDSDFAMAYRKLAAALYNTGTSPTDMIAASRRAFQLRDRLPPLEGDLTTAWYYDIVDYDITQVIAAYRSALDRDPDNYIALNNLAMALIDRREWAAAESLTARAIALGQGGVAYLNAAGARAFQGRYAAADSVLISGASRSPNDPSLVWGRAMLAGAQGEYDRAEQLADSMAAMAGSGNYGIRQSEAILASISGMRGQLAASAQHGEAWARVSGAASDGLTARTFYAFRQAFYLADTAAARRTLDDAIKRYPLSGMPLLDRPYSLLAMANAWAGRPAEARRLLDEYARSVPEGLRKADFTAARAEADIALAEGKWRDAIANYRSWNDVSGCTPCGLFEIGRAFDHLGETDSALVSYVASTTTPDPTRLADVGYATAPAYHRIGEIYEAQGDRTKALAYYQKFVDLWKDADPQLQPLVRDARARIARLTAEH